MNLVEAVRTPEQRTQLEVQLLDAGQIYFDLWKVGVNLALRISDLLSITMADVKGLDLDAPALHLVEQKTGKKRKLVINGAALKIMQRRLADNPKHKFLFQSEAVNLSRYSLQPINRRSVCRVFESAGRKRTIVL